MARNGINSVPQTAATTFAFYSVLSFFYGPGSDSSRHATYLAAGGCPVGGRGQRRGGRRSCPGTDLTGMRGSSAARGQRGRGTASRGWERGIGSGGGS